MITILSQLLLFFLLSLGVTSSTVDQCRCETNGAVVADSSAVSWSATSLFDQHGSSFPIVNGVRILPATLCRQLGVGSSDNEEEHVDTIALTTSQRSFLFRLFTRSDPHRQRRRHLSSFWKRATTVETSNDDNMSLRGSSSQKDGIFPCPAAVMSTTTTVAATVSTRQERLQELLRKEASKPKFVLQGHKVVEQQQQQPNLPVPYQTEVDCSQLPYSVILKHPELVPRHCRCPSTVDPDYLPEECR